MPPALVPTRHHVVCRFEDWNAKETEFLNETQLITSKPVVYLLNLSEKNYVAKKGKWLKPVFEWVQVRRRFTRRRPSRCWSAFAHTLFDHLQSCDPANLAFSSALILNMWQPLY